MFQRLTDRLADNPAFLAHYFDEEQLVEQLGCDRATAMRLRLCRKPRHQADVERIAAHLELGAGRLAAVFAERDLL